MLKMTCALNFSQTASPLERTLEMMQFEVGMGSTHTILTHSPAFDVPNGKTKPRRSSTEVGAVFPYLIFLSFYGTSFDLDLALTSS